MPQTDIPQDDTRRYDAALAAVQQGTAHPASAADKDEASSPAAGGFSRPAAAVLAASVYLVPLALSLSTSPTPNHPRVLLWYASLRKPAYQPPDPAIPLAWTVIESALATAAYRLLRRPASPPRNRALGWLALNTVSIGAWSRLFFGRRDLPASTVAAAAMIGTGAAYVAQARRIDRSAAAAGVPYVAWVAFATVLTAALWRRNR